jgi:hypothetical protein
VVHKTKLSGSESRLEMLLNLCQEAKETIENIPGLEKPDAYRILLNLSETCSKGNPFQLITDYTKV